MSDEVETGDFGSSDVMHPIRAKIDWNLAYYNKNQCFIPVKKSLTNVYKNLDILIIFETSTEEFQNILNSCYEEITASGVARKGKKSNTIYFLVKHLISYSSPTTLEKTFTQTRSSQCWKCKHKINTIKYGVCSACNWIPCGMCGACHPSCRAGKIHKIG